MSICEIDDKLERIAVALEAIQASQATRYTYEEFIEDIEDAFGIGSILGELVSGIIGLMPNLRAKVDFTPFALGFIETWTRWKPLHGILATQAASLGIIAAAQGTSKILALISTIFQALDVVGNGWRSLIMGDANLWDDFLKPLYALFISTDDGGDGGENPDADNTLRIAVQLNQSIIVRNTINALCCGAASDIAGNLPTGTVLESDATEIVPGTTPPQTPGVTWEVQNNPEQDKCRAANYIVSWLVQFYGRSEWSQLQYGTSSQSLTTVIQSVLAGIPPIGVTLAGLSIYIGQALAYLATGSTAIFDDIKTTIQGAQNELVCALFDAVDVATAKSAFLGILEAQGVNPLELWTVDIFLSTNNVLGLLWYDNDVVDYSGETGDCSGCSASDPCALWDFTGAVSNFFVDDPTPPSGYPAPSTSRDIVATSLGLQLSATAASGNRSVYAVRDGLNMTIQSGQHLIQHYTNNVSVTTRFRVILVTNVGARQFYVDHGAGEFTLDSDISAFAGETISEVVLAQSTDAGNILVTWHDVEITCI